MMRLERVPTRRLPQAVALAPERDPTVLAIDEHAAAIDADVAAADGKLLRVERALGRRDVSFERVSQQALLTPRRTGAANTGRGAVPGETTGETQTSDGLVTATLPSQALPSSRRADTPSAWTPSTARGRASLAAAEAVVDDIYAQFDTAVLARLPPDATVTALPEDVDWALLEAALERSGYAAEVFTPDEGPVLTEAAGPGMAAQRPRRFRFTASETRAQILRGRTAVIAAIRAAVAEEEALLATA